jgi:sulfatase maturation enzyme AslB (radical SAM superfamily)
MVIFKKRDNMGYEQLNSLGIYLTERCNFDCSYCYYKKTSKSTLSKDQIREGIRLFFDQIKNKERLYISILGGEPLLETEKLFYTIDLINEEKLKRDLNVSISIFTNGSLLTNDLAKRLVNLEIMVCISLDGIKISNDCYRKFKNSDMSTYEIIMNNLKKIKDIYRKKFYINMVFTPKTCKYLMESFNNVLQLGTFAIDFHLSTYEYWSKKSLGVLGCELKKFIKFYISLFNENSKNNPFFMYQLGTLIKHDWKDGPKCRMIKLGPDGRFYFCDSYFSLPENERKRYSVGDLSKGIDFKKRQLFKIEACNKLNNKCKDIVSMYSKNKRAMCLYLIYVYCKTQKKDLNKVLKYYYRLSGMYSKTFLMIDGILSSNKKYREMYEHDM